MWFLSKSAGRPQRCYASKAPVRFTEPLEGRFLLSGSATLSGMVFHDSNQNGSLDGGEVGVANLKIWLDLNSNGTQDASDPVAFTDSNGNYQFTSLPGGDYTAFLRTKGWNPQEEDVLLKANHITTQDFAAQREQLVSGYVFEDANRDGIRQAGEAALAGVTVQARYGSDATDLDNPDDSDAVNVKTDATGHYRVFVPLPLDGAFLVKVLPSANHRASTSAEPGGSTVEGGSSTFDLGATQSALIHCVAFDDDNDNQVMDFDSEDGIQSLRAFIDSNKNGVLDAGERSGLTDANGACDLGPLTPGHAYRVILIQPDKSLHTTTQLRFDVRPTLGQVVQLNFGFAPLVTLSGTVFKDLDANLVRSSSEKPAGSMLVYADLNDDGKPQSTEPQATTDSSGQFQLRVLGDELCAIRIGTTGWRNSNPSPDIVLENRKSLLIGATQLAGIDVEVFSDTDGSGTFDSDNDENSFDLYNYSSIWLDENRDGSYDWNEPNNSQANFAQRLNSLQPGTYQIGYAPPDGWDQTTQNIDRPISLKTGQLVTLEIGVFSPFG